MLLGEAGMKALRRMFYRTGMYSVFKTPSICALLDLKRYSSAHIICVCTNVQYVLRDLLKDLSFVDTFLDEILVKEGEIESM